jgi:hypothetical protein
MSTEIIIENPNGYEEEEDLGVHSLWDIEPYYPPLSESIDSFDPLGIGVEHHTYGAVKSHDFEYDYYIPVAGYLRVWKEWAWCNPYLNSYGYYVSIATNTTTNYSVYTSQNIPIDTLPSEYPIPPKPPYPNPLPLVPSNESLGIEDNLFPFWDWLDFKGFSVPQFPPQNLLIPSDRINVQQVILTARFFKKKKVIPKLPPKPPNYYNLAVGYFLDDRKFPEYPVIDSDNNFKLGYYKRNKLEPISDLVSIDWREYEITKGKNIKLPIVDAVLGTLWVSDNNVKDTIESVADKQGELPCKYLFKEYLAEIIDYWRDLYNEQPADSKVNCVEKYRILRLIAANNNVWTNADLHSNVDINPSALHPMFIVDEGRAYNWHFAPQSNGSFGSLIMDSPRVIETLDLIQKIVKAFDILKWCKMPDSDDMRTWNLGEQINAIARVLGLRRKPDGKIDRQMEKDKYLPATLNNPSLNGDNYDINCFGDIGYCFPHLPTAYAKGGKGTELWDVVADIPQMMQAILRQLDTSLGIQHGSEIRTRSLDGSIKCYPNQLSLFLELDRKIEAIAYDANKTLATSIVTSNEVRALFSGIGIPTTQKFIPLRGADNNQFALPYFSHQKNQQSISNRIAGLEIQAAIVNGILLPKKQPKKAESLNPLNLFVPQKKP